MQNMNGFSQAFLGMTLKVLPEPVGLPARKDNASGDTLREATVCSSRNGDARSQHNDGKQLSLKLQNHLQSTESQVGGASE
jgi:hypothetical protein